MNIAANNNKVNVILTGASKIINSIDINTEKTNALLATPNICFMLNLLVWLEYITPATKAITWLTSIKKSIGKVKFLL